MSRRTVMGRGTLEEPRCGRCGSKNIERGHETLRFEDGPIQGIPVARTDYEFRCKDCGTWNRIRVD